MRPRDLLVRFIAVRVRLMTFRVYAAAVAAVWTVVLVLAAAGAIPTRLPFLLVVAAAWAAAFALAAFARARLPHPRARSMPWLPPFIRRLMGYPEPQLPSHDFRLHRGSFAVCALLALLAGAVVTTLAALVGGLSGDLSIGAFCVSFGWLIGWVQVTIVRQLFAHPNPRPAPWQLAVRHEPSRI
jgi:hypothetical protein